MEEIRKRIQATGAWSILTDLELKAFWKHGVEAIKDEGLRATVAGFLETVPPAFFTAPASKSGKHHPPWQNGAHGTLRSITECCVLIPPMSQYIPGMLGAGKRPNSLAVDVALAATIVSDTYKLDHDGTDHGPAHGRIAAGVWKRYAAEQGWTYDFIVDKVAEAVVWHYGIWTPEWRPGVPLSPEALLVHLVDAFTAQKALALIYQGKGVIE
jgi:hypothetical protein